jgi:hypothetical protein
MTELHPAASQHLPAFITAPGETDVLMIVLSIILVLTVLMFGGLFFRLHTMPERMAHRGHKIQFEIVAVLGLLALFTHIHLFWVAGLLLALIDIPDFGGSLSRIAGSTEKLAGIAPGEGAVDVPYETAAGIGRGDGAAEVPPETTVGNRGARGAAKVERPGKHKEPTHA